MKEATEAQVTKAIRFYLKLMPHTWHFKHWGGMLSSSGIPDIIGVMRGRFFAIEVKAPGRKPKYDEMAKQSKTVQAQIRVIKNIRDAGGIAFFADSLEDVRQAFDFIV